VPAKDLENALRGIECLARYAALLLRWRKRGYEK
jgi:hypothetical protein